MTKEELIKNIKEKKTCLCVGLDPDVNKFPPSILSQPDPIFTFNKAIIDAVAPFCVAFKPNTAFYECHGIDGWRQLEMTIDYIKSNFPSHLVIADAKRGDIGNTSRMYAKTFFETLKADGVTVAPYMGKDSLSPFLDYKDKWTVVLALTSNLGSSDFQMLKLEDQKKLYQEVLIKTSGWGTSENLMFVVGATKAVYLKEIRSLIPDHFLLVPGVGAQGGSLAEVMIHGKNQECGLLINSSRGILYASSDADFALSARKEAQKLAEQMAQYL